MQRFLQSPKICSIQKLDNATIDITIATTSSSSTAGKSFPKASARRPRIAAPPNVPTTRSGATIRMRLSRSLNRALRAGNASRRNRFRHEAVSRKVSPLAGMQQRTVSFGWGFPGCPAAELAACRASLVRLLPGVRHPYLGAVREETDFLVFATIICHLVPDLVRL